VSFYGTDAAGTPGIYVEIGGVLSALADTTTAIPGGTGAFTSFGILTSMDGGEAAFKGTGTGGQVGIYRGTLASLVSVADTGTLIPMGTGSFTGFEIPSLDAGQVAFQGIGSGGQRGIYLDDGQSLSVIVDATTPVPGDTGQFLALSLISLDAGNVAFRATTTAGGIGVYAYLSGELSRVVDLSAPLFGKQLTDLTVGQESLSGEQVVFHAVFGDGSKGVYLATALPKPVPLLPPLLLLGLGAILLVLVCKPGTCREGARCR